MQMGPVFIVPFLKARISRYYHPYLFQELKLVEAELWELFPAWGQQESISLIGLWIRSKKASFQNLSCMKHHCNQQNDTNYAWYEAAFTCLQLHSLPRKEGDGELEENSLTVYHQKHFLPVHFLQYLGPLELSSSSWKCSRRSQKLAVLCRASPSLLCACCIYLALHFIQWKIKIGNRGILLEKANGYGQSHKPLGMIFVQEITSKRLRDHLNGEMLLFFSLFFHQLFHKKKKVWFHLYLVLFSTSNSSGQQSNKLLSKTFFFIQCLLQGQFWQQPDSKRTLSRACYNIFKHLTRSS